MKSFVKTTTALSVLDNGKLSIGHTYLIYKVP